MQKQDFKVVRGDTWERELQFTKPTGNVDITGWTLCFTVKEKVADPDVSALISKTITSHTQPLDGITTITLTPTDTDLTPGTYIYDMQLTSDTGSVLTFLTGAWTVEQDITIRES